MNGAERPGGRARRAFAAAGGVLLAAAPASPQGVHPAVGHSEAEVLACVGAPEERQEIGQSVLVTYRSENYIAGDLEWCEARIEVVDGNIIAVLLRDSESPADSGAMFICAAMFRPCGF